jgi:transcriptional regulator with XRE-family HTH domain
MSKLIPSLLPKIAMAPGETAFYEQLGRRIAERRKVVGITQVQLAETLGIAQQTMAHYEGGKVRFAAALLPVLADALALSVEELIGPEPKWASKKPTPRKRGPAPKIQQQLERLSALPRSKQRFVSQMLDSMLAQASR